jgi:hypothetical protein
MYVYRTSFHAFVTKVLDVMLATSIHRPERMYGLIHLKVIYICYCDFYLKL